MCLAEMPNRSSSSSGLPLRGISATASRCTRKPAGARALCHRIADPAGRVVILDGDDRPFVACAAATSVAASIGLHRVDVDHPNRNPLRFSRSYAFSASNSVTPAPTTVATSAFDWRSTFDPPTVNASSLP